MVPHWTSRVLLFVVSKQNTCQHGEHLKFVRAEHASTKKPERNGLNRLKQPSRPFEDPVVIRCNKYTSIYVQYYDILNPYYYQ